MIVTRCCASIFVNNWPRDCPAVPVIQRDGKHYCKKHDPVAQAERARKALKITDAKWAAFNAQRAAEAERDRKAECFDELLAALEDCVSQITALCSPSDVPDSARDAIAKARQTA